MRARNWVAIGLVLLPAISEAQQRPRIRLGGQPPRTAGALPDGPQPRVVREALRYRRLKLSAEGYTFVSRIDVPSYGGIPGESFTTGGAGTRIEYRFNRMLASTLDVTQSFIGGPVFNESAELGFRFGPSRASADIVPFADARAGYFFSQPRQQLGGFANNPQINFASVMDYSHGPGIIGGGGVEFAATRRFSVVTAATYARARLTARRLMRSGGTEDKYTMSAMRYIISLRFNGVKAIPPSTR